MRGARSPSFTRLALLYLAGLELNLQVALSSWILSKCSLLASTSLLTAGAPFGARLDPKSTRPLMIRRGPPLESEPLPYAALIVPNAQVCIDRLWGTGVPLCMDFGIVRSVSRRDVTHPLAECVTLFHASKNFLAHAWDRDT